MQLKIKNTVDEIPSICDKVKEFCEEHGVSDEKYHDIILIIDEVATNVISYAYPDGEEHLFSLDIDVNEKGRICIKLTDDGIPFNPLQQESADTDSSLEERQIGGLGIFIVKHLAETVEYSRMDDKNNLYIAVSVRSGEVENEKGDVS